MAYHKKKSDCFITSTQCSQHQGGLAIWICKINISLHFKKVQYCFIMAEKTSIHNCRPISTISRIRVYMTPKQNVEEQWVYNIKTILKLATLSTFQWDVWHFLWCLNLLQCGGWKASNQLRAIAESVCSQTADIILTVLHVLHDHWLWLLVDSAFIAPTSG